MKSKFLKIAGVKSDKAFYKKYPTEAAFFKAHPEAKESIKKAQWGDLLSSFSQNIPDMQTMMQGQMQSPGVNANMFPANDYNKMYMGMSTADEQLSKSASPYEFSVSGMDKAMNKVDISKQSPVDAAKGPSFGDQLSKMAGPAGQIIGGIEAIGESKKITKRKKGIAAATNVIADAAESTDVDALRQYVQNAERKRNALMPVTTGEEFFPVQGVGTNVLRSSRNGARLEDGGMVGGNPTEIQNTYGNGNSLYDDLEYEPLYNIDQVKSYRMGGYLPKAFDGAAMSGMMSSMGGGAGGGTPWGAIGGMGSQAAGSLTGNDGGGQIGGAIGGVAGMAIGGPAGQAIGQTVGTLAGGLFDTNDRDQRKADAMSKYNMDRVISSQFTTDYLHPKFGANLRDGGYMNPEYNPQVITMFGDHDDQDFADYAQKDQFRAGGHLKAYREPSERAMQTYAMGGELKTHWGGYAEPISYNPYLPDGGETVMFRGQSHDESDGKGRTGIGVTYGNAQKDSYTEYAEYGAEVNADVEVERNEPAVKLKDGSSGEESLVVYGNLKISKDAAKFIGDKKAEGMKYKNYIADKSKFETKQNKLIQKSTEELGELDPKDAYDKLKVAALEASIKGGKMNLKQVAEIKEKSAFSQNTINETAEKYGIVADDLARGKVKFDKESMTKQAKFGASVPKAQYGLEVWEGNKTGLGKKTASEFTLDQWNQIAKKYGFKGQGNKEFQQFLMTHPESSKIIKARHDMLYGKDNPKIDYYDSKLGKGYAAAELLDMPSLRTTPEERKNTPAKDDGDASFETKPYKRSGLLDFAGQLLPYIRPTDQEELNPNQLLGEMNAMIDDVEPVQAIPVSRRLRVPYEINRNVAKNNLISQTRAAQRLAGYNPALQAYIASQAYSPMQQLQEQDFIDNQRMTDSIFSGNIDTLNDADDKNRQIYDQQYVRQSQARSNTKAIAQAALNSISDKYAKNALENKTLGVMENMYNYRYDNAGRAINMNAPFQANIPYIYGNDGKPTHKIIYAKDKKTILGYQPISKEAITSIPSEATPGFNPNPNVVSEDVVSDEYSPIDENDIMYQERNGGKTKKKKYSQSSIVRAFK
jgi:hypothetical protein